MMIFTRTCCVYLTAIVLVTGSSATNADDGPESSKSKPVTSETRTRILQYLLSVVRDSQEKPEVRAEAARSLGRQTAEMEADNPFLGEVRSALMKIVKAEEADPGLRLAAIKALRVSSAHLTEEQLKTIGEVLWTLVLRGYESEEEISDSAVVAVHHLNQYARNEHLLPPPNVTAVRALLAIREKGINVFFHGEYYDTEEISNNAIRDLNRSEQGLRLLIKTLDSLVTKSRKESESEILLRTLSWTEPTTEGIAQILLKAASHENPTIRQAAIKALGGDGGASSSAAGRPVR